MKPERWEQINDVLIPALEREAFERSAFVKEACGGDDGLCLEVGSLLASHEQASDFLEESIVGAAARLIVDDRTHLATGQRIDHYQILSLLGVGGMGEVYLVRDTTLGRQAAIKLLPSRFTVIVDTPRISAVSSTDNPPKYLSSTMRDFRGSTDERRCSASSSATLRAPPPRLA